MNTAGLSEGAAAAETAGAEVATQFAQRVAQRDVPPEPAPLRFDAYSVQERLQAALRSKRKGLTAPRRAELAQLLYQFLTTPVLDSTAHARGDRTRGRDWLTLMELELVERLHAGRQRRYRLSRAGEDWLLAVVQGTAAVP